MSDIDIHNQSVQPRMQPLEDLPRLSLNQWIYGILNLPQVQIRSRLRGNNLHVLCESSVPPDASQVVPLLIKAFSSTPLERFLPDTSAQVYRVMVYGRRLGQTTPEWTESFPLHRLPEQTAGSTPNHLEGASAIAASDPSAPTGQPDAALRISVLALARQGRPDAIARYLSRSLSHLGIAVRARVEDLQPPQGSSVADGHSSDTWLQTQLGTVLAKRLLVACESAYVPDPLMAAEPIAQRLRQLELRGFRDAIVFAQVTGETRPEWMLRVDLTPTDEILKEWARWGDVQAITRLLNRVLKPQGVQTSAILKDSTLHLSCLGLSTAAPDKLTCLAAIAPILETIKPQGIQAATIYGIENQPVLDVASTYASGQSPENGVGAANGGIPIPLWVYWLDLPTTAEPKRLAPTMALAQQGDLAAISFLLSRLLNPNLDKLLATGGIRVQVRQKGDLIHIMTDAPNCPRQEQVGPAVVRFLKPLQISGVTGVRVYGRRAGQKQPLWSFGSDFTARQRLVPEATPEFAASDAYVSDLLSPPGALVLRSEVTAESWRSHLDRYLERFLNKVQHLLIRTQLFIPSHALDLPAEFASSSDATTHDSPQTRGIALVWGVVGLLIVIQSDWILSQWSQPNLPKAPTSAIAQPTPTVSPSVSAAQPQPVETHLPQLSLQKQKLDDPSVFSSSGFTQPGSSLISETPAIAEGAATSPENPPAPPAASLPASPLQPKAPLPNLTGPDAFPSFNSRQLDLQLAVYRDYLEVYGPPDVLVVGSSRALRGIDPTALASSLAELGHPGIRVFNLGVNGATAQVVALLVEQILPQDKLPKLILWADGARAFNSGRQDVTFNGIVASKGYQALQSGRQPIPGTAALTGPLTQPVDGAKAAEVTDISPATPGNGYQVLNQRMNRWFGSFFLSYGQRDRVKSLLRDKLVSFLPEDKSAASSTSQNAAGNALDLVTPDGKSLVDINGFLPLSVQFNPVTYYQKYARVSGAYDSDFESFNLDGAQTQALVALVQATQARNISLVFVNLPLTREYLDPVRQRYEDAFQQHLLGLAPQLGLIYRNLNGVPELNRTDYFSDPSHLNRYGAYEVTRRLAQDAMIPWSQLSQPSR
jgi:hypothetical protein